MTKPTILAFLQNQWFRDPPRMREILERMEQRYPGSGREKFIRTFLFYSCLTGKRLRNAFGQEMCDEIVWEEVSPEIGGKSSSCFPADVDHIHAALKKHQPVAVLTFGRIAGDAIRQLRNDDAKWGWIAAPHPAARGAGVVEQLSAAAKELKMFLNYE